MQLPAEVDVVVSGGGLKGFLMLAARPATAARGHLAASYPHLTPPTTPAVYISVVPASIKKK